MQGPPNYYPNLFPLHFPLLKELFSLCRIITQTFPPSFEGIIYSYQRVKYLDLSERLDINCEFTVEPNHAICSNLAIEI